MAKAGKGIKQRKDHSSRAKQETPSHARTSIFICEIPLRVTSAQERTLLVRLETARQVYNACLGEAKRRVGLVRQSKQFQRAQRLPKDDPTRNPLFSKARTSYDFTEYAL